MATKTMTTPFFSTLDATQPIIGDDLAMIVATYIRDDQYARWDEFIRSGHEYWHDSLSVDTRRDWSIFVRATVQVANPRMNPLVFTFARHPRYFDVSQSTVWKFMCGGPLAQAGEPEARLRVALRKHFAYTLNLSGQS